MSGNDIQFGIRITADGKSAVPEVRQVKESVDDLSTSTEALRRTQRNLATDTMSAIAAAEKHKATLAFQSRSFAETTKEMRAQAAAATGASVDVSKLLDKYDPLSAKLRQLQADFKALNSAASSGGIGAANDARVDAAYARLRQEISATQAAMSGVGPAASANFGKVVEGAEKSAFATVGARRELMVLGHEAMSGNFSQMPGSMMVLMERTGMTIGPMVGLGLAVVGTGAAVAVMVAHSESAARSMNALETSLAVTGRGSNFTRSELKLMIDEMARAPGVSKDMAEQSIAAFAHTQSIGASLFRGLTGLVADYAAATGEEAPKAAAHLAKMFADPVAGAKELSKVFGNITGDQTLLIEKMAAQGRATEAQKVLFDALNASLSGASKKTTEIQAASTDLKNSWNDLMHSVGDSTAIDVAKKGFSELISGMSWLIKNAPMVAEKVRQAMVAAGNPVAMFLGNAQAVGAMVGGQAPGPTSSSHISRPSGAKPVGVDPVALNQQVNAALALGAAYQGVSGQLNKLNDAAFAVDSAMTALSAAGQRNSASYRTLKIELGEINKQITDLGKSKDTTAYSNAVAARIKSEADLAYTLQETSSKSQLALLDMQYKAQVLSLTDYLAQKQAIEQQGADAAIQRVMKEIAAEKDAYEKSGKPEDRERHLAAMNKLIGDLGKAAQQSADVGLSEFYRKLGETNKYYDDLRKGVDALGKTEIAALDKALAGQQLHNAEIGKTAEQKELERAAIENVGTARLQDEETALRIAAAEVDMGEEFQGIYIRRANVLKEEIVLRKRIAGEMVNGAALERQAAAAKAATAEWKKGWEETDRLGRETFLSWEDSGGDAAKKIGKTLEKALLSAIYAATLRPIMFEIYSSAAGALGMSAPSGAAGGAMDLYNYGSAANTAYGAATGTGVVGSAMSAYAATATYAEYVVVGGQLVGVGAPVAGGTVAALGNGIQAGMSAMGPVGWIALAALAAYVIFSDNEGAAQRTGNWVGGLGQDTKSTDNHWFSGVGMNDGLAAFSDSLKAGEQKIIRTLGLSAEQIEQVNVNIDKLQGKQYGFGMEDGDWTKSGAQASIIHDRMQAIADALNESLNKLMLDITFNFTKGASQYTQLFGQSVDTTAIEGAAIKVNGVTENVVQTMQRLVPVFSATNAVADLMGKSTASAFGAVGLASESARENMVDLMGGMTQMSTTLNGYYAGYFTDSERHARDLKGVGDQFASLGYTMPGTRAELRAMIDAQDLSTESGRAAAAALIGLSGALATVTPSAEEAAAKTADLQNQVLELTGNHVQAVAIKRQQELSGMSATDQALQMRIYALQDEAEAVAKSNAISQQRFNLEIQYANLTGNNTLARVQELQSLDPSNRAMQIRIWSLQDEQAAAQNAAQGTQDVASAYQDAYQAQQDYLTGLVSFGKSVKDFLSGLNTGVNASTSPESRLSATRDKYISDLRGARSGDADAYASLTKSAQEYIGAGSDYYASGSGQQAIIAQIKSEMGGLTAVTKYDANVAALRAIESAINSVNASTQSSGASISSAVATIPFAITESNLRLLNLLDLKFDSLDTDLSGGLSSAEFRAGMSGKATDSAINALFQLTDTNHDGIISRLEANNAAANNFTNAISSLQTALTNGSYAPMTYAQFSAKFTGTASDATLSTWFSRLDTNGDGMLSAMEVGNANTRSTATDSQLLQFIRENTYHPTPQSREILAALQGPLIVTSLNQVGNSLMKFANGGVFDRDIISSPTYFNMGLAGEAGPEAIMPLSRINGRLGVASSGGHGDDKTVAELKDVKELLRAIASKPSSDSAVVAALGRVEKRMVAIEDQARLARAGQ